MGRGEDRKQGRTEGIEEGQEEAWRGREKQRKGGRERWMTDELIPYHTNFQWTVKTNQY